MLQLQFTKRELEQSSRKVEHLTDEVSRSSRQLDEIHKQLLEYERMAAMGRMATVINHELRNIFSEIQASIASLKEIVNNGTPQAADCLPFLWLFIGVITAGIFTRLLWMIPVPGDAGETVSIYVSSACQSVFAIACRLIWRCFTDVRPFRYLKIGNNGRMMQK